MQLREAGRGSYPGRLAGWRLRQCRRRRQAWRGRNLPPGRHAPGLRGCRGPGVTVAVARAGARGGTGARESRCAWTRAREARWSRVRSRRSRGIWRGSGANLVETLEVTMAVAVLVTAVAELALVLLRGRLGQDPLVHAGHVQRIKLRNLQMRFGQKFGHVEAPDRRWPGTTVSSRPAAGRRKDR